jgi:hypothetical protein
MRVNMTLTSVITTRSRVYAAGTCLRPFEKLSLACVSNQHTARHCNRIILRVDFTRIRKNSTCMRAGSAVKPKNQDDLRERRDIRPLEG